MRTPTVGLPPDSNVTKRIVSPLIPLLCGTLSASHKNDLGHAALFYTDFWIISENMRQRPSCFIRLGDFFVARFANLILFLCLFMKPQIKTTG